MRKERLAVLAIPLMLYVGPALSEQADMEPGKWSFTHNTTVEGQGMFPEHSQTSEECLTAEDISDSSRLMDVDDNCEVVSMNLTPSRLDYVLMCTEDDMQVQVKAEMNFAGTTMNGRMSADLETPMGPMVLSTLITGERVGACDD